MSETGDSLENDVHFEDAAFYTKLFIKDRALYSTERQGSGNFADSEVTSLNDIMCRFVEPQNDMLPSEASIDPKYDRRQTQKIVIFAIREHGRITGQYRLLWEHFYSKAAAICSILIVAMSNSEKPVFCRTHEVERYFQKVFSELPLRKSYIWRLTALTKYVARFRKSVRFPPIPIPQVRAGVRDSARRAVESMEFSPYGICDDLLVSSFLASEETSDALDVMAGAIVRTKKRDYSGIESVVGGIMKSLKPKTKKDVFIVRCAIRRIVFDRIYLKSERGFVTDTSSKFMTACKIVQCMSPVEMEVKKEFMKPEHMTLPFATLVSREKSLQDAVGQLEMVQYYTNPIDMMACVFEALKGTEEFVRMNAIENRVGGFLSMFETSKMKADVQMAFDDLFPLFCALFCCSAPANARALCDFMDGAAGLVKMSAMEFATMFYKSATEYVEKLDVNSIGQTNENDDDPLGMLRK